MRAFKRAAEPAVLQENGEKWGDDWAVRKAKDPSAKFHWHEQGGKNVNKILLSPLKAQTQEHCSFCDSYPVSPPGTETIEHFHPKGEFPKLAYTWDNLYFCCNFCQQQKGEKFDEALLRPDAEGYDFNRYFRWSYTRGRLLPNEDAGTEDQERARVTINLYRLNDGHPKNRLRERHRRAKDEGSPLDSFAYRNFVENAPVFD